jgi:hypothetical protein
MTAVAKSLRSLVPGRRAAVRLACYAAVTASLAGCTAGQKAGESSSYLIIQSLQGASGAEPEKLASTLASDVVTNVKTQVDGKEVLVPTIFDDAGRVTFRLALKDPGTSDSPTVPSSSNFITVNRYRVHYVRTDGRSTPGVDVPYDFESAMTATVTDDVTTAGLSLVRIQAKMEAPLKLLAGGGGAVAITTIAEVTFYGYDQAGREVSVMGRIGITFADWGDPESSSGS